MQTFVFSFKTLIFDIGCNRLFISVLSNGIYEIPIAPEFSTPQDFLYFWNSYKYLFGSNTLHHSDDFCGTVCWNRLNQEVNMVFVCPNLKEFNFIPFTDFKTDITQNVIYSFIKHNLAILGR